MLSVNFNWKFSRSFLVNRWDGSVLSTYHLSIYHSMENKMPTRKQATNPIRIWKFKYKHVSVMIDNSLLNKFQRKLVVLIPLNKLEKRIGCVEIEEFRKLGLFHLYIYRRLDYNNRNIVNLWFKTKNYIYILIKVYYYRPIYRL